MRGISKRFLKELEEKEFRDEYTASRVRTAIAYQIRALRSQRELSQQDFSELLDKPQSVVSRLENPEYGKLSVQSLLDVASALDVQLVIQFVESEEFLKRMEDVSPKALEKRSFDAKRLNRWAVSESLFSGKTSWIVPAQYPDCSLLVSSLGNTWANYESYPTQDNIPDQEVGIALATGTYADQNNHNASVH